jgi:hypothetical protein
MNKIEDYGLKVVTFAGEGEKIHMAAVFTFDAGKAVVQVAAIDIMANHLLYIEPPEAILSGEILIIYLDAYSLIHLVLLSGKDPRKVKSTSKTLQTLLLTIPCGLYISAPLHCVYSVTTESDIIDLFSVILHPTNMRR